LAPGFRQAFMAGSGVLVLLAVGITVWEAAALP
jgi:hypothetical protein